MDKVLLTGNSGFIGSNILPILQETGEYEIYTPKRHDLDLKDSKCVEEYLIKNRFDTVLHLANPNPVRNTSDSLALLGEDSLRIFMNLYSCSKYYKKMIYTGSGAEFDKSLDMDSVAEEECHRSIPKDSYGFAKYVMNCLALKSENIYNFRVFGCYGPGDAATKFITHCIRSVLLNKDITIRKDCKFDYIHVFDLSRFLNWGITSDLKFHDYNACSGSAVLLSEIAAIVKRLMNSRVEIKLISDELNRNYTASNKRISSESGITLDYPLETGIQKQIEWEIEHFDKDTLFDGE